METDHAGDDFSAAKQNDCPAVDFRPAKRWGASKQDVWSVINEGAEASRIKPCVNLSQGYFVWMAFLNPGDEVMLFEPYFDQSLDYIHMAGGVIRCVPLRPPAKADFAICWSSEWTINFVELEQSITSRTKMIVINTPHNPTGMVFSREELRHISGICVRHNLLLLSDEVYDRLSYVPFTRVAILGPDVQQRTISVGSVGKHFFVLAGGWAGLSSLLG
ncbi:arylformamidase [Aspergillus tubingensis]